MYAVYRWVPTAARLYHPLRYGTLLVAGLVPIIALGADRLAERRPRLALASLAAALGWATWVGPWPLPLTPFPGPLANTLRSCTEVLYTAPPGGAFFLSDAFVIAGLSWRPSYPHHDGSGNIGSGPPTATQTARGAERMAALAATLEGDPSLLPVGSCVVFDAQSLRGDTAGVQSRLFAALGKPEIAEIPAHTVYKQHPRRLVLVYRAPDARSP
jgi:hypothetical protein